MQVMHALQHIQAAKGQGAVQEQQGQVVGGGARPSSGGDPCPEVYVRKCLKCHSMAGFKKHCCLNHKCVSWLKLARFSFLVCLFWVFII